MSTLTEALALAEPEGYVRTFADKGSPTAALLSEAQQRGRLAPDVSNAETNPAGTRRHAAEAHQSPG